MQPFLRRIQLLVPHLVMGNSDVPGFQREHGHLRTPSRGQYYRPVLAGCRSHPFPRQVEKCSTQFKSNHKQLDQIKPSVPRDTGSNQNSRDLVVKVRDFVAI